MSKVTQTVSGYRKTWKHVFKIGQMIFLTSNIVRTRTEHFEHEHLVNVVFGTCLEPNLECRFRFGPKTPEPEPNRTPASLHLDGFFTSSLAYLSCNSYALLDLLLSCNASLYLAIAYIFVFYLLAMIFILSCPLLFPHRLVVLTDYATSFSVRRSSPLNLSVPWYISISLSCSFTVVADPAHELTLLDYNNEFYNHGRLVYTICGI